jgi:hypothetical protein
MVNHHQPALDPPSFENTTKLVEVGTRVAPCPLTDPGGRFSRTGLFRLTRTRIRLRDQPPQEEVPNALAETQFQLARLTAALFHNPRSRHLESGQQSIHLWPGQAPALTPPIEPFMQCLALAVSAAGTFQVSFVPCVSFQACHALRPR